MEYKKPELNEKERWRLNTVYHSFEKSTGNQSKEKLCAVIGWNIDGHDRQIREIISTIAKRFPIISLSGNKGYRMAKYNTDLDDVERQIADLESRINEMKARQAPLKKFAAKARAQIKESV